MIPTMKPSRFASTSRYYGVETATLTSPAGETIVYLRRRFIPPPEMYELLVEHTVTAGERLDNITTQHLGDPEQFWRVADANNVLDPAELTETVGQRIRITLPQGVPGYGNA
ncbi:MAG: LysM domain-containing protein [Chloroflexi bacterium]|nr:LysM domain-containing protein [Chloroflexota bacterium]